MKIDPIEFLRARIHLHVQTMASLLINAAHCLTLGQIGNTEAFLAAAKISEHEALLKRYELRVLINTPRVGIKTSQLMAEERLACKPLGGSCWCVDCTYKLMEKKLPLRDTG